jgi:hypothetical protein
MNATIWTPMLVEGGLSELQDDLIVPPVMTCSYGRASDGFLNLGAPNALGGSRATQRRRRRS